MRYLMWQFRHMHTLYVYTNSKNETYCPVCGAVYQKAKPMSTNRDDVTPAAKAPKEPKSSLVLLTFVCLLVGAVCGSIGAFLGLPWLAVAALFHGLTAIALAVLSLRERQ